MADLKALAQSLNKADRETLNTVVGLTKAAIADGVPAAEILEKGLIAGMAVVGERFKKNEVYVPEVLIAARAMNAAMEALGPELVKAGVQPLGTVVLG
ncbi:MAG: B12-binding domain-containing protein, partial [Planctomycetota bacterium]